MLRTHGHLRQSQNGTCGHELRDNEQRQRVVLGGVVIFSFQYHGLSLETEYIFI